MWRTLTRRRPAGAYQLFQTVVVPAHRDLDHVVRALAQIISRHQSLRTTFRPGPDGALDQVVHQDGVLPVRVVRVEDIGAGSGEAAAADEKPDDPDTEGAAEPGRPGEAAPVAEPPPEETAEAGAQGPEDAAASALTKELLAGVIPLEREFGLRAAVVTREGWARRLVLVYSHLAFDEHAEHVLATELGQLLTATSPEDAAALLPPAHQPAEQARREAGDRLRRVSRRSLDYWRSTLTNAPPRSRERHEADPGAPIWSAALASESAARAEACLVGTYGLGSSALYLGAMALALGSRLGRAAMTFLVPVSNRFDPMMEHYVANLVQATVVNIDLGTDTFHTLVRRIEQDLMRAYLHARYDPDTLATMIQEVEAARPTPFDLGWGFNDARRRTDKEYAGPSPKAATDTPAPPDPDALGRPSDLTWRCPVAGNAHFTVHARVARQQGRSVLDIGANVTLLSRDEIADAVLATERVLVRAAHGDVPLGDLRADGGSR